MESAIATVVEACGDPDAGRQHETRTSLEEHDSIEASERVRRKARRVALIKSSSYVNRRVAPHHRLLIDNSYTLLGLGELERA